MKTLKFLLFQLLMTAPSYGVVVYSNSFDTPTPQTALWYGPQSSTPLIPVMSYTSVGYGNRGTCLTIDVSTPGGASNAPSNSYWGYATLKTLNYPVQPAGTLLQVNGLIRLNSVGTTGKMLVTVGGTTSGSSFVPDYIGSSYINIPVNRDVWIPFSLTYSVYPQLNSRNPQLGNLTVWFDGGANWNTGTGSVSFDNILIQTVTTPVPEPNTIFLLLGATAILCVVRSSRRTSIPLPLTPSGRWYNKK